MLNPLLRNALAAFALLVGAIHAAGGAPEHNLSLAEARRLAVQGSAQLQSAQAHAASARARVGAAGALATPLLVLGPHIGDNTGGLDEDILVSQSFELGDKRRQRVRSARAEALAAQVQGELALGDLALAVDSAYYDAQRAEVERQQAADALATAQQFATAANTQFQAGDVARSNVVRSRIEVARSAQALAAAETDLANRYDALRSLVGLPQGDPLRLTDPLVFAPINLDLEALLTRARAVRPELRVARALRTAREADLHGARASTQPDLLLEGRHRTLSPTDQGDSLRFAISIPLFDLGRNRSDTAAARSALAEQDAITRETLRTVDLDVRTAYRTLTTAEQAVRSFDAGRLAASRELLDMARIGYGRGANSYLELLDAQQVYRSEQVEHARALAAYNAARAALTHAVGGSLP